MSLQSHLFMIRPNLAGIAAPPLPPGFSLRAYRPGDDAAWLEIIRRGYGSPFPRSLRSPADAGWSDTEGAPPRSPPAPGETGEKEQVRPPFGSEAQAPQQSPAPHAAGLHAAAQARRHSDRTGGDWPEDSFQRYVLADPSFRPERLFFIALDGGPFRGASRSARKQPDEEKQRPPDPDRTGGPCVATAAAFQNLLHGDRTGYVHMMAVLPEFRRRGLGAALLGRCLLYFREQGWRDAVLDTEVTRLPAIQLYLANGFEPFPEAEADVEKWRTILAAVGRPDLAEKTASYFTKR